MWWVSHSQGLWAVLDTEPSLAWLLSELSEPGPTQPHSGRFGCSLLRDELPQPEPTFALFALVSQCLRTRLPWWNSSQFVLKVHFILTWSQLSSHWGGLPRRSWL